MDIFGVPKKINRHVLKALYYMNDHGFDNPNPSEICEIVEITMKNNNPVRNLNGVVRQSLQNMAQLGVIERNGPYFFVRNPVIPTDHQNDSSKLDPNMRRRRHASEDSMSGNEIEKSRKRFRSSRPLSRRGHCVMLPKARSSRRRFNVITDLETNTCVNEEVFNGEEVGSHSDCSINTTLKEQFLAEVSENEVVDVQSQDKQLHDKKENSEQDKNNDETDPCMTNKTEPDNDEVVTAEQ